MKDIQILAYIGIFSFFVAVFGHQELGSAWVTILMFIAFIALIINIVEQPKIEKKNRE
jgi:purine-cytosine permease-like protein